MADNNTIARPYAQAIFDIAKETASMEMWAEGLMIAKVIFKDSHLNDFLSKPSLSPEQKLTFISELFSEITDETMIFSGNDDRGNNLIKLLIENSRISVFPEISEHFNSLKSELENSVNVTVSSAVPLSEDQKLALENVLKKRFDSDIYLQTEIDETLVGGAVIRTGDVVIDGSLRASLSGLSNVINS
jgi:F-type H+-transporting ATPase subunit delta